MTKNREELGKYVRQIWIDYCLEIGDTKPSHIAPWSELSERDKEADRRIGEAIWDAAVASLVAERDALRTIVEQVAYFGEALIHREYEPGSQTIKQLVDEARSLLGAAGRGESE